MSQLRTVLLVILFAYAGGSKLADPREFSRQLYLQPLPEGWVPYLTYGLPLLELVIALSLLIPGLRLYGLWAYAGLMSLFTVYIALILLGVFERIPCSCGGVLSRLDWPAHLLFNAFFLLLSLWECKHALAWQKITS